MLHYRYIPHLLSSLLFGVCLLSLSCSGAYPAVTLGANLVTNTGFESNTTGWTLGASTARDTAVAHTGTSSIRLNGAAAPTSVYVNNLSCLAGRKVKLTAWVKTLIADAASGGAVLEVKCFNTASRIIGSRRSTAVATNGAWQQIQLITLIPINAATMRVTLLNTSQTASAWFDDIICTFPDDVQFRTLIRQPQYRQTVYSGQPRKIIVGAEVYDSISYPASSLAIRADLLDTSSSVIATALLKTIINKSWQNIGISIPSSATGNLTVRTRLIIRATEAVLKETTGQVTISPSALPRVHFDVNNRCIVNGTPFFPIGIYGNVTSTADLDRLKACGINTVLDTGMLSRSLTEQSDFLSALNSRNMMGVFSLKDIYDPLHGETTIDAWGAWTGVSNTVAGLVNANKNNQALLAWYINEDRTDDYIDQIKSTYTQITTLDPDHPCFQAIEGIQDYPAHAGIADITGFGTYPIWQRYKDSASPADMPILGSQTRVANKAGMYSRPVWMITESGKFPQTPTSIAPTAQQMLCEAYQAIINGARGVFLNNLPNAKLDGEPQWQAMETVAANLKAIAPIALGQDVPAEETVTSNNTNVECVTRRVGDDVYILAVNTSNGTVSVSLAVPEKLASVEGHAVDRGVPGSVLQRIVMSTNTLTDSVTALGPKVYKLTKSQFDILKESPKPNFKSGHTLPKLSYFVSLTPAYDIVKELAENWGYTLMLEPTQWRVNSLDVSDATYNPNSVDYRICTLATTDPTRYQLHLIPTHDFEGAYYNALPETTWTHTDSPGTVRTRTRTIWSSSTDVDLGEYRQCADLDAPSNARVYKCIQSAGSKENRPVPEGNAWWVLATNDELDASPGLRIFSPEAPTSIFEEAGTYWAAPIKKLKTLFPTIKTPVIINGAEAGLDVLGWTNWWYWRQDPAVWQAVGRTTELTPWYDYISTQKARQEAPIANAFRAAVPDHDLYINYTCSGTGSRDTRGGMTSWKQWAWDYSKRRATTDLPAMESYYGYYGSWITANDLYSQATNRIAQQIALGDTLAYNFVSAGWLTTQRTLASTMSSSDMQLVVTDSIDSLSDTGKFYIESEIMAYSSKDNVNKSFTISARGVDGTLPSSHAAGTVFYKTPSPYISESEGYMGFLKMLYAIGTISSCQFYGITYEADPNWLWQFQDLGHVHALYSYLEDYLRNGDLLTQEGIMHRWSTDLPAYEFTTGYTWTRVVARKKKSTNDWLIAAWAQDGIERNVNVTIPVLGTITLNARPAGSVYTAVLDGTTPVIKLIDTDAMNPTAGLGS